MFSVRVKIFLIENKSFLNFAIAVFFYLLFSDFGTFITLCGDESDPCMEALKKSLEDIKEQKESQTFVQKTVHGVALDGKTGKLGTGTVEQGGKVYVVQTAEVVNQNDGTTVRRISDCVSAKKTD